MTHDPVDTVKKIETARYSYRNWSYEFECPHCGRERRYNANYLGRKRVVCDGEKFTILKREDV